MSEEEKDILIAKRKYWTKLMKYNLVGTVLFLIYVFVILSYRLAERCEQTSFSDGTVMCNSVLISYLLLSLFLLGSWPLSLIMYGYQSFKIYKITKPKVLAKSSEMSLRSTQKHNGAMGEDEITRLKSIADLRDSGVLTDDEFQEQKSRILAESTGVSSNQTHFSGEGEPPMEGNSRYLFYILSFLIPLAGVIIGIIYYGKPEPWHKEFGKRCLELALSAIVLLIAIVFLSFVFVFSSF
jgi:hypothetical protein